MATWHVRPGASHSGTRDGTSYATAWGGWSEIVWGASGVTDTDRLEVHGPHAYASNISVGAHGAASEAERVTITGLSSVGDNGSIVFSGSAFLQNTRPYTTITELDITAGTSNCLFVQAAATNSNYVGNIFRTSDSIAIALYSVNGQNHADVLIDQNTFYGASSNTGSGAAIGWFVSATGAVSTLTGVTITRNTFSQFNAGKAVIHLRAEDDTDASSAAVDLVISNNTFDRCLGPLIWAANDRTTVGINSGLRIFENTVIDCGENASGAGGFGMLRAWADAEIYENIVRGIGGTVGFANVFYGSYRIYKNDVSDITTTGIDGNGLLFDHGAVNCAAWGNKFRRIVGSAAVNSGCGIMVLDATGVVVTGNDIADCKWGIHLGAAGGGQGCSIVFNTITGCADGAVYAVSTADLDNCDVKYNIFTGDGYSVYDLTAVSWSGEDYNCMHGFSDGASSHTLGENDITDDPLLDAANRLTENSPCRSAGIYIPGARHFGGKRLRSVPDMGAHRYFARSTTSSRGTTLTRAW